MRGGVKGFYSAESMLFSVKIDILILALPNSEYRNIIELDSVKNLSIVKEKPLARSSEEAEYFLNLIKQKQIKFNIVQNRFFANHYVKAKEWLDKQKIGEVLFFEYRYVLNDKKESWYWDLNLGGGCWLNVGWHFAFLIEWFFGTPNNIEVRKLQSSKRAFEYNTDDIVFVDCSYKSFEGKAYMSVVDSFMEDSFKIVGSLGSIHITKDQAILLDNGGEGMEKEKAEMLLSYMKQYKGSFLKGIGQELFDINVRAMNIINNNV